MLPAFVTVSVTDCNDNAPKFSNTEYHIQVSENSVVGTRLVQVHAYDPDVGANGLVRYDIVSGNSKQHLTINSQSGVLAVNQSLDYEEDSKYTVTVRACDGSETSDECNVAFAVIYVTVLDENDNAPYFIDLSQALFEPSLRLVVLICPVLSPQAITSTPTQQL
uniref:Cadherin domain-containing protein n=1 Tax=Periophthalmus magnuspinnatus TaxID=409849 RepID=A0A3B3Z6A3_9GOBI